MYIFICNFFKLYFCCRHCRCSCCSPLCPPPPSPCSCASFFKKWTWCLGVCRILNLCFFASFLFFLSEKKTKNLFNSCQQYMEVLISPTLANTEHSYSKRSLYSCACLCGTTHSPLDCGFTSPTSPKKTFQNSWYHQDLVFAWSLGLRWGVFVESQRIGYIMNVKNYKKSLQALTPILVWGLLLCRI